MKYLVTGIFIFIWLRLVPQACTGTMPQVQPQYSPCIDYTLIVAATQPECANGEGNISRQGGYVLAFDDEFNEPVVNTAIWQVPMYDCHFINASFEAGGEWQYYLPQNLSISNGVLNITTQTQTVANQLVDVNNPPGAVMADGLPNLRTWSYTSGSLRTWQKFPAGKYEIKCKMPTNKCLWPSFWMRYDAWNGSQEMDDPDYYSEVDPGGDPHFHCNLASPFCSKEQNNGNEFLTCSANLMDNNWHIIDLEWDPYNVYYLLDGEVIRWQPCYWDENNDVVMACDNSLAQGPYQHFAACPYYTSMNMLIDVAVRFNQLDQYGDDPAVMQIDYARGYVYMDCNMVQNICDWHPDKESAATPEEGIEDPTVYTGSIINVAGNNCSAGVIVNNSTTGPLGEQEFLDLYASTQVNLENGFVAQAGSYFIADIVPCQNLIPPDRMPPIVVNNPEQSEPVGTFSVTPNPTKSEITAHFQIEQEGEAKISLINLLGGFETKLYQGFIKAGYQTKYFNLPSLASGVYLVKFVSGNYVYQQKLIISN